MTKSARWFVQTTDKQVFMYKGQRYETVVWTIGGKPALFDRERLAKDGLCEGYGFREATPEEVASGTDAHDPDTTVFDRSKMQILT